MSRPLYAVIMAGGSGTRFWPASRLARPKQYLPIVSGSGAGADAAPMIRQTWERLDGLVPPENVLVVTAAEQAPLVRESLPELPAGNLLAEPEARNTAPCVALAAFEVRSRDPDAVQVVLPADHLIRPADAFRQSVRAAAAEAATSGALLTFGIRPTRPATGYGYIQSGDVLAEHDGARVLRVKRFVEKPERRLAEEFLASGDFLWNAGIFVWTTEAILAAVAEHAPEIHAGLQRVAAGADLAEVYAGFEKLPVDVAILERAGNVRTIAIDYSWSDVGSWAALADISDADEQGNWAVLPGGARLVAEDASGCLAFAEGEQVIALVGVRDLVVVQAGNATLVCPRDRAQEVRRIVERLGEEGPEYL